MQSVFAIITKLIAFKTYFCKEVFFLFGRAGYPPKLPYRGRGEGVAGGIVAQAALWRVSRYIRGYR